MWARIKLKVWGTQVLNKRMRYKDRIKPEKADIDCTKGSKRSTMFPCGFIVTAPPIQKATWIQYDDRDSRLAFRLAIPEYQMAEPKPKISVLSMRSSIRLPTLRRYAGEVNINGSQYKGSRSSKQWKLKKNPVKENSFKMLIFVTHV